jgi:hypothetical protein
MARMNYTCARFEPQNINVGPKGQKYQPRISTGTDLCFASALLFFGGVLRPKWITSAYKANN